jgi:small-conductance mechanosensitive channel
MQLFLSRIYFGNSVADYGRFLIALAIAVVALAIVRLILFKILKKWASRSKSSVPGRVVHGIRRFALPLVYFGVLDLCLRLLNLTPGVEKALDLLAVLFVTLLTAAFLSFVASFAFNAYWAAKDKDPQRDPAVRWMGVTIRVLIWGVALILFLDNIGVKINSLIAGLGISGIAIAFAAQAVLADIFCFFTIFFDKPFEVGDLLTVGNQTGTVEKIGIKTTRLRSVNGEMLIFSNTDLTSSRLQNYKSLEKRRVLFTLAVTYDTPLEKLEQIPGILSGLFADLSDTVEFGRAHFTSYGAYSLNFEVVYYILGSDYLLYLDTHQKVNFRIRAAFDEAGIDMAFPTQTLHVFGGESPVKS